jgi:hypothetical protein
MDGILGKEANILLKKLAGLLARMKWEKPYSEIWGYDVDAHMIIIVTVRAAHLCLLGSASHPDEQNEQAPSAAVGGQSGTRCIPPLVSTLMYTHPSDSLYAFRLDHNFHPTFPIILPDPERHSNYYQRFQRIEGSRPHYSSTTVPIKLFSYNVILQHAERGEAT